MHSRSRQLVDPWIHDDLVSLVQDGISGVKVLGMVSAAADHVHLLMSTVYPLFDDCFQEDNTFFFKAQIISR